MKLQKPNKWNKTIKNRIWNGSILAAFIAAAAVFAVMLQTEKRTLAEYEKKEVYVAATDIPRGEELTQENIEDYVMPLEIDQRIVPGTAVTDRESLYGRITVCDIGQGSVITGEMTEGKEQILGEMTEPVIAGFRAEDLYQVVGEVSCAPGTEYISIASIRIKTIFPVKIRAGRICSYSRCLIRAATSFPVRIPLHRHRE
mgnify:CR=1 FL=1